MEKDGLLNALLRLRRRLVSKQIKYELLGVAIGAIAFSLAVMAFILLG